mgnify:CR=1 FL=1
MQKSESIKELATALAKAQGKLKGALKDASNPFFKSKYADLASVVEAIRQPFAENGLSYVQTIESSDKDEVRIETMLLHASGEWLSCGVLAVPVSKADAQGYGSALTYARRYGLSAACGVAPEDDDGNAATKAKGVIKPSDGAMESLEVDIQTAVRDVAEEVKVLMSGGHTQKAVEWLEAANFTTEAKIACWDLLPSNFRSAIKKYQDGKKAVKELQTMKDDIPA